jgi:hypothetical protein
MGKMQRSKGQVGEREAAALIQALTGWEVRRRVRNAAGDSDLVGVPGWSVEIKRYASASRADIATWWQQCVTQAGNELPVLFYRLDRADWRGVWPLAVNLRLQQAQQWQGYEWTVEGSMAAWAAMAREVQWQQGDA